MEPKTPITALIQAVEKLISRYQESRRENARLRRENTVLQQKITDFRLSEQRLQQTVSKLEYKNDLAKAKVESIINRLQAIDAGLQETAQARAAAHTLAQTALGDSNTADTHSAEIKSTGPNRRVPTAVTNAPERKHEDPAKESLHVQEAEPTV